MRIAALASHGGSILQAVIDAIDTGALNAQLVLVVSNNSNAGALQRAAKHDIPTAHLSTATHPDPAALDAAIARACLDASADWLLLTGYMKRLGPATLAAFPSRILNTHPALLPKFGGHGYYGSRVHEAVLQAREQESGATVHFVEGDYDTGPIYRQCRVPVLANDTPEALESRVKAAERELVVAALAELSATNASATA